MNLVMSLHISIPFCTNIYFRLASNLTSTQESNRTCIFFFKKKFSTFFYKCSHLRNNLYDPCLPISYHCSMISSWSKRIISLTITKIMISHFSHISANRFCKLPKQISPTKSISLVSLRSKEKFVEYH